MPQRSLKFVFMIVPASLGFRQTEEKCRWSELVYTLEHVRRNKAIKRANPQEGDNVLEAAARLDLRKRGVR